MNFLYIIPLLGILVTLFFAPIGLIALREKFYPAQLAKDKNFVPAFGYQFHYTDEGDKTSDAVVLLHGFAAWGFTWRNQVKALLGAGYRVVTIDQLSCGASSRAATLNYTTQHQAEYMLAVLDALQVPTAHLVGHSYGGRLALQIALLQPQRVRKLVAISAEAFATARPPIAKIVNLPGIGYMLGFYSTLPQFVRPTLASICKQRAWLTDAAVKGYAVSLRVWGNLIAQIHQSAAPKDRGDKNVPQHLADVQHDTFIIWGDKDPVFPATDGEKLAKLMPNAALQVLTNVGHLPHEEKADEVSSAIISFLQK